MHPNDRLGQGPDGDHDYEHVLSHFFYGHSHLLSLQRKNSQNPRLLWKWVSGSRSHSDVCVENRPKIALNQY